MIARWLLASTAASVLLLSAQAGIGAEPEAPFASRISAVAYPTAALSPPDALPLSDASSPSLTLANSPVADDAPPPVYSPPQRGAPESRVSGGTRGSEDDAARVFTLAPKEAGETVTTTPTLYWFVSQPVNDPVELTIAQDGVAVPLLDVTLAPPARAGIYAFSLAREHVELKRGVEYRWSVALIANSAQPAKDIVASGDIICVEPSGRAAEAFGRRTRGVAAGNLCPRVAVVRRAGRVVG